MKVEKVKKEFEPRVITIETHEEFCWFQSAIHSAMAKYVVTAGDIFKNEISYCGKLLDELNK